MALAASIGAYRRLQLKPKRGSPCGRPRRQYARHVDAHPAPSCARPLSLPRASRWAPFTAACGADKPARKVKVDVGQIAGARFAIANPPGDWNHRLLLVVHGYRPESAPLVADLNPDRASNKALLEEGWMVATTSFRRNGLVIADAIADLDALRKFIAEDYGDPERILLEGESLGGLIVTLMAERETGPYDGAVVFDATLYAKEANGQVGLSLLPRIPLLFVATEREAAQSKGYLTALVARPPPVVPAGPLPHLARGPRQHQPARAALRAARAERMDRARARTPFPAPRTRRGISTQRSSRTPGRRRRCRTRGGAALTPGSPRSTRSTATSSSRPRPGTLRTPGIPPMTYCTVRASGRAYRTLYGRTYTDVKKGEWVAFPDADGRTVLSRVLADAAGTASLRVGDPVSLDPVEPGGAPSP